MLFRRFSAAGVVSLLVLGVVLLVAGPIGGNGPGAVAGGGGTSPSTERALAPVLRSRLPSVMSFPGKPARLPLPKTGEAAVVIPGLGTVGESPAEQQRPIASLTKLMTAYIILKDHPLSMSGGGPVFEMTAADHAAWVADAVRDDSNLEVKKGERLDERQLLEALMIPSADNIADYLASWDAGSVSGFVAKMNVEAKHLGLLHTHYADPSGLDPRSRSTAHDQAVMAGIDMESPVLRSIVDNLYVRLPIVGLIWNVYNPAIHVDGIIGVKSGFTRAAKGCLATAAWRFVGGRRYLVVSTAVGMPLGLSQAAQVDEGLLKTVSKELSVQTLVPKDAVVATALARWDRRLVGAAVDAGAVRLAGWPGLVRTAAIIPVLQSRSRSARGWPAGSTVATLELSNAAGTVTVEPVVLQGDIPPPPPGWTPPPN
jgi:D-alanyl-D-alanine carboxypeptidase (penicillin-binding protein 5/6)